MTTVNTAVDNGVNVDALLGVRTALTDTPEIAQFQWRTTVSWINGTHSRSTVDTFYGFGEPQQHKMEFSYDADHPWRSPRKTTAPPRSNMCWSPSAAA